MKPILALLVCIAGLAGGGVAAAESPARPHLEPRQGAPQLVVDGRPFLILGGELNNSSSSSSNYLAGVWPRLVAKHLNTVLAAVSWELIEPVEGRFDFSTVDAVLAGARQHGLRLVLLWFGSWKNGLSSYPPAWVKSDPVRFPLAEDAAGRPLDILSTFGANTVRADATAFAALMRHLRAVDGWRHTVLMMQVENEVGIRDDSRDRSPAANAAWQAPVPPALMNYLARHAPTLAPELSRVWAEHGCRSAGDWSEVFGPGKPPETRLWGPEVTEALRQVYWRRLSWASDEFFMAWRYATFINQVAAAGKAQYNLPMYVNAWLQQPGCPRPGEYPSGGPVPQVQDIWRWAAPSVDFYSPDLYLPQFEETCDRFTRNGNPLFIPEANTGGGSAQNALTALLNFHAIGFSPFGIDGWLPPPPDAAAAPPEDALAATYAVLDYLSADILATQGSSNLVVLPVADDTNSAVREITMGDYHLQLTFGGDSRFGGAFARRFRLAPEPAYPFPARLVIHPAPDEFVFVGAGLRASFTSARPGHPPVAFASFDEAMRVDGRWVAGRRLNGDQTDHDRRWPFLRGFSVLRVKVYSPH